MAGKTSVKRPGTRKKTSQGNGKFTHTPNKGGGKDGSLPSKRYKKKKGNRGQGKK